MEIGKNPAQVAALLEAVSKKLGVSPETLRSQLEAGKFDSAIKGMGAKERGVMQQVLADPQKLSQIMSSKQARALYEKLTK